MPNKQSQHLLLGRHPAQQLIRYALSGRPAVGWIVRDGESAGIDRPQSDMAALWQRLEALRAQQRPPFAAYQIGRDQPAQALLREIHARLDSLHTLFQAHADTKGRVEIEAYGLRDGAAEALPIELAEDGALYHASLKR